MVVYDQFKIMCKSINVGDLLVTSVKREEGADCIDVRLACIGGGERAVVVGAERNRSDRGHNLVQENIL